jgi:hypothetical protein
MSSKEGWPKFGLKKTGIEGFLGFLGLVGLLFSVNFLDFSGFLKRPLVFL